MQVKLSLVSLLAFAIPFVAAVPALPIKHECVLYDGGSNWSSEAYKLSDHIASYTSPNVWKGNMIIPNNHNGKQENFFVQTSINDWDGLLGIVTIGKDKKDQSRAFLYEITTTSQFVLKYWSSSNGVECFTRLGLKEEDISAINVRYKI